MKEFSTIEELCVALATNDANEVLIKARHFLDQKVKEKDSETKQFLIELATQETATRNDVLAASKAINLLSRYHDANLLEMFLMLLDDHNLQTPAIYALQVLGDARAIPFLRGLLAQKENPHTLKLLIGTLMTLGGVELIELALSYLTHPHPEVRKEAMSRVLNLAKLTGQEQWAYQVLPLLEDPEPTVRRFAALCLKCDFPHLLPD